jgi:hypothetical protein
MEYRLRPDLTEQGQNATLVFHIFTEYMATSNALCQGSARHAGYIYTRIAQMAYQYPADKAACTSN